MQMDLVWRVLLIFLGATIINAYIHIDTPPTVLVDRNWTILNTEPVGSVIVRVHGSSSDGRPLEYGLESIQSHGPNKLPFRIDKMSGVVYLNESILERTGEHIQLYVTASNGRFTPKSEVLVNIINSTASYVNTYPGDWQHPHRTFNMNNGTKNLNIPLRTHQELLGLLPSNIPSYINGNNRSSLVYSNTRNMWDSQNQNVSQNIHSVPPKITRLKSIESTAGNDLVEPDENELPRNNTSIHRGTVAHNNTKAVNNMLNNSPTSNSQYLINNLVSALSICAVILVIGCIAASVRSRFQFRKGFTNKANEIFVGKQQTVVQCDHWEIPRHKLKFFSLLGEGAFGQVWKCEAIDIIGRNISLVAVKTLKKTASEKEKSDFLSEIKIMKMLDKHQHIVSLIGCCTKEDPIFLVMEYVGTGTLQNYLRKSRMNKDSHCLNYQSKSLTSHDLTTFVYQVANGMNFLSSNGVIHRDLAARNVLLTDELVCKIADFGFARDISTSFTYERKSDGKLPIRWMAPESLYDNIFTTKSDVWSFGVLMWEVVTLGSTPYPGLSAAEVMKKVKMGHRLDKPEHCKRELHNIMYYCWETDPNERPSFDECSLLLEHLLLTETSYIELERFPDHSYYNLANVSNEKL